ncbi:diacylglycerol/lipid kinase family protein [Pediococcus stilesii]|uniref:Diacylglycerol kinase family lipid kinase n=1 Tax=Pediococcus stilesii TaxID=331679 RepID=A0A0R2L5L0_9LACO|nr:diacylglycerol kinase family protein [Pediococcus stilesii]KRN94205.1 diacylglycerol kinase family lipid kinase [Pediococcus stilesii]
MKDYLVIYNKKAGSDNNEKIAKHFNKRAQQNRRSTDLKATTSRKEAIEFIVDHLAHYRTLVTIGGDGSINTVFTAFLRAKKSIRVGIIPGGTVNNFAKALNIPENESEAIEVILTGKPHAVDLIHTQKRAIISSLTLGTLADMARNVSQNEKRKWGPIIYLIKGIKQLIAKKSYRIEVHYGNSGSKIYQTRFLLATTTNSIGGFTNFDTSASPSDGKIHLVILKHFSISRLLGYVGYFLTGQFQKVSDVDQLQADQFQISTTDPDTQIETRIDGDPSEQLPIKLNVERKFIDVIVPDHQGS